MTRLDRRDVIPAVAALFYLLIAAPAATADPIVLPGYAVERVSTGGLPLVQPVLAVDNDDNIYVGRDFRSDQSDLLRISPSGEVVSIASFTAFIGGLTVDS